MMRRHDPGLRSLLATLTLLATPVTATTAQQAYHPAPENLMARAWFQDAKFWMFIHWDPSSVLQDAEWVMQNRKLTVGE